MSLQARDLDYVLPERLIAQRPLDRRSDSRLLWLDRRSGEVRHRAFRDLPTILTAGDLLVTNVSRVSARRLMGHRSTGGSVEMLVTDSSDGEGIALCRPAKKLRPGERVVLSGGLEAEILEDLGTGRRRFRWVDPEAASTGLATAGHVPLPPYVHEELPDEERYQTVYGEVPGSAAAPTAGLHFDEDLLAFLGEACVGRASVELAIGLDTFRPIQSDSLADHVMHGERYSVPEATVLAVGDCQGRIVAVGTSSCRTLETCSVGKRRLQAGPGESRLLVSPGYEFKVVDGLLTNFHLPRTTMLAMVAALAGIEPLMRAYREAVREEYRFLSFGDAMLIV
ncbi:MAG: tRNA preQ1(34) S-adenosylmethionine ribosyltransferase-isomerase QueA [Fimbriimonadaceae bacterium]